MRRTFVLIRAGLTGVLAGCGGIRERRSQAIPGMAAMRTRAGDSLGAAYPRGRCAKAPAFKRGGVPAAVLPGAVNSSTADSFYLLDRRRRHGRSNPARGTR